MITATRDGGGAYLLAGHGWLSSHRRLLMALLFVLSASKPGVHCIAPAPLQNIPVYHQFEANALKAVFNNWTGQNPQLTHILKWSLDKHPCTGSAVDYYSEGAWRGVFCTPAPLVQNATGNYYVVSVTTLMLYGSNSRCGWQYNSQCGFDGINGVLPSEISQLINVDHIWIDNHPELRGPVPLEIWQMPNLTEISLMNNSLNGPLASNVFIPNSKLFGIYLYKNQFNGRLQVNSNGTLFSSSLKYLNVSFNQLDGPVDFQGLDARSSALLLLDLSNNHFNGTFSTGPYLNPESLFLSNNAFTSITFANYTGQGTVYMPKLINFFVANNKFSGPFPVEILQMPNLQYLDLSTNNFSGSVDFRAMENSWITRMKSLDFSRNNFYGLVDFQGTSKTLELKQLDISNNSFTGTFFASPYLDPWEMKLSNNHFNNIIFNTYNGTTPHVENGYMPSLKILNIQNNNLSGEFPIQILKAPNLQVLNGGQNQYKGTLELPSISTRDWSLTLISLTNNHFDGVLNPNVGHFSPSNLQVSNLLFLSGNPICNKIDTLLLSTICRSNQSAPALPIIFKSSIKNKVIIATSTSTIFTIILLVAALYVWKLMGKVKSLNVILREFEKKEVKPNLYSYKEIKSATKNFDKENKLGEGGFGIVFKGELFDGTIIAVKKLTMSSCQKLSEFLNEVVVISGLKHRNLVKLKGCCLGDGDQRMLVFEYVENRNLAEALSIQGGLTEILQPSYLNWTTRFNIIIGIARGLAYLHEDLHTPIIHRDIKASNILLDKDYNPKIADFGLAFLFPILEEEESHLTLVQVAGTRGYCSPEYALHGHISTALDVYSFGILLLEIISGRKCIDHKKSSEESYLREWAWQQFEAQTLTTIIDPKMEPSSIESEAIIRVISVALACVHYKAAKRPKMQDVVPMLLGNMPIIDFCMGFEYGEALEDEFSTFSRTTNSKSSFWKKKNLKVDERSLLNDTCTIELNEIA